MRATTARSPRRAARALRMSWAISSDRKSEDCLTLNIWTPAADDEKTPGAGVDPWRRVFQRRQARCLGIRASGSPANGEIVVVSINYRLGALGFLCLPGVSPGNLGLRDQVAALRFVRDNIAAFGGDPTNVTVVGQSAGASSIAMLLTMPLARGLFRRAIMQSTPFGRMTRVLDDSHRIGRRLLEVLELKPDEADKLKTVPVAQLLAAQGKLAGLEKKFADALAPFWPTIDGEVLPGPVPAALKAGAGAEIDTMIGTTREEMAAFYCIDKEIDAADQAQVEGVFAKVFGSGYQPYYDEIRGMRASHTNAALLGDLMTDAMFRIGSLRIAEWREQQGHPAYVYQFDWQSPAGLRILPLPRDPVRVQQFRELAGLAHAQGREPG